MFNCTSLDFYHQYNWFTVFLVVIFISFYLRSSVGPRFAKTRAMIFAVIGFIFLAAGIGVTVGTLDLAERSGGKD